MSSDQSLKTEILQYIDPHLVIKVLDFELSKSSDKEKQTLLQYKKQVLFKTCLFEEQSKFNLENKSLGDESSAIELRKQQVAKIEEETKDNIKGFLNLMENFRKSNNFDTSSSMHKKIVKNKN
jgi:hypothetical protein